MNHQPNELIALEWLITPLNEQINALHIYQADGLLVEASLVATEYQAISGVLTMAELPQFAQLAQLIATVAQHISHSQESTQFSTHLLNASVLLQHELNHYARTGFLRLQLVGLRTQYLQTLLQQFDEKYVLPIQHPIGFSRQIVIEVPSYGEQTANKEQITQKWQMLTAKLIQANQNLPEVLEQLQVQALLLSSHAVAECEQKLWALTASWLDSLSANAKPLPKSFAHILSDLVNVIDESQTNELWVENLLADVYVNLAELQKHSAEAKSVIEKLNDNLDEDQAFFPYVLSVIESIIYGLAENAININVLEGLHERLVSRGWSFYALYVNQILSDAKQANESQEMFAQMQWQISTQLQDLYGIISNTHSTLENKVGVVKPIESNHTRGKDTLREVRILVEDIKAHFSDYLYSKNTKDLPKIDSFQQLSADFNDMGMYDVASVSDELAALFENLHTQAPEQVGWQFAHKIADGLSLFEMFLDNLAQQIFDESLLVRTKSSIEEATQLLSFVNDDEDIVDIDAKVVNARKNVVVYDDEGEHQPENDTPQTDSQMQTEADTPLGELSEAYLAIRSSLKADDFSHDQEFREIFIEEAEEVVEELQGSLTAWQENIKDLTVLKDIRRNFHTLKGSGRMVGALQVGETAWYIENLLNRVLDNTIAVSQDIATLVVEAATIVPAMVTDFANGRAPSVDNVAVILKANNILSGVPVNQGVPSTSAFIQSSISTVQAPEDSQYVPEGQDVQDDQVVLPEILSEFMEAASQPPISTIDEVDDDIKEIFIEEAQEVLSEIVPTFASWREDQTQRALLVDIRRGFHTLKGSGRMVGAMELGELAWSIENMLNRVLDNTVAMDEGMSVLVSDVLADFDKLVGLFAQNTQYYPQQVVLWTACAHAYAKGHGSEFDYRIFSRFVQSSGLDWSLNVDDDAAQKFEEKHEIQHRPSIEALNSIQEAGEFIMGAKLQSANDEEEELLCQIFIEEAKELLADIKEFLAENQNSLEVAVNDDVVRVFHTLRGASGLPSLAVISEVSTMIERSLQGLQQHEAMMTPKHLQALGRAVELIEAHLGAYETSQPSNAEHLQDDKQVIETLLVDDAKADLPNVEMLIEGIDTLLDAELELEEVVNKDAQEIEVYAQVQLHEIELLSARTLGLPKFQSLLAALKSAYELLELHPEQSSDDRFVDLLLATHHQMVGLFDSLAGSMSLRVDKTVLLSLNQLVAEKEQYYAELGKTVKEENTTIQDNSTQDDDVQDGEIAEVSAMPIRTEIIEADDELLQIFLEEATELDAAVTAAFADWRTHADNVDYLKTLQRHLHTIKGGARLAGIVSIGDLTHEAESVYERFTNGQMKVSDSWIRTMQRVQDILSLQLDSVKNTRHSFFADETIEDLRQYLSLGEVPAGALIRIPMLDKVEEDTEVAQVEEVLDEAARFKTFIDESWHGNKPDDAILSVFLEEARELAESSSEDFAAFRNNTSDVASLQSLQRKLHTIKGGARMVSANGMADLAHEMETVYENLGNRRRPATRMVANLLFACHDWITVAVSLLEDKYNPPRPTPLIDSLQQFMENPDSLNTVAPVSLEQEVQAIAEYKAFEESQKTTRDISRMPPLKGIFGESVEMASNIEMIRISAPLMERMINLSGEAAINRARIDMNMASLTSSIEEMGVTVQRLADQLRRMDNELEEQILAQIDDSVMLDAGFDPLEMDQYSSLNQLSKSLSESASDLLDIKATLLEKTRDGENLLLQLSRTQNELQDSLMNSRMVPFSRLTPRLQRIVRQTASELGKNVDLTVINADGEMDRSILERITSPLEHMLRNAVDHGVEMPSRRHELGKPLMGHITLEIQREGGEMVILLSDDGAGVNVEAVRKKAINQGLIREDEALSDTDIMQYIFNAGLSTTSKVTQISGRGVGMDVVRTEIRQLGGSVSVESKFGEGSRFIIRVPLTVAVSDALIVRVADRQYAIPLVQIERVLQVNANKLLEFHQSGDSTITIDERAYRLRYLNEILAGHQFDEIVSGLSLPVIVIKNQAGQSLALQVDEIVGSRIEVVVKPLGRQLSRLSGVSAATIMGDGSVMLILDPLALMRTPQKAIVKQSVRPKANRRNLIMVVDDSVTVRKVTSRFLERQGFDVVLAKDGVDAIEILQDTIPDLMLLDIEMPRMDGFEVATQVRHSGRLKHLPIIMITSRTGEKHRERAFEIGVNEYMGKPFQEIDLLARINKILGLEQRLEQ